MTYNKELIEKALDGNNKQPIEVIDIDEQSDVAMQYGIRSVPTLIMFENDMEIKRISGNFASTATLQEWIEN
jgi:thioredoxin-like negative regulator of GroEL